MTYHGIMMPPQQQRSFPVRGGYAPWLPAHGSLQRNRAAFPECFFEAKPSVGSTGRGPLCNDADRDHPGGVVVARIGSLHEPLMLLHPIVAQWWSEVMLQGTPAAHRTLLDLKAPPPQAKSYTPKSDAKVRAEQT
mmetsp:Transcript_3585/g.7872  ORF Transcript_3585/g.7872 Transcript_3585/m.7872 type:complete len:135 (-) Transcript_3585:872-1276(-)